jgi:hypothetical protein
LFRSVSWSSPATIAIRQPPIMQSHTASATERIRTVLAQKDLLADYARMSYAHVNGFVALTIDSNGSTTRRLHWWPAQNSIDSQIHNHARSFTSSVLLGTLQLTHYCETGAESSTSITLQKYHCRSGDDQSGYHFLHQGPAYLNIASRFSITRFSIYSLQSSEIHSVRPLEETVTDVSRGRSIGESLIYARDVLEDFNNKYLTQLEFIDRLESVLWRLR